MSGSGNAAEINKCIGLNLTYAKDRMACRKKSSARDIDAPDMVVP